MPDPRTASLALVLLPLALSAQEPAESPARADPRFAAAAVQEAATRSARIRAEIASLGEDPGWAGSYYRGDGLGVNVSVDLAPEAGFVFTWSGCLGVYDRNYGAITEKDGRLHLRFTFANVEKGFCGLAPGLVPVRWGERRYLAASDQLRGFANAINGGGEPRDGPHGGVLLRRGDERKPVKGLPELPEAAAALLLAAPVTGTIVAVHERRIEQRGELRYRDDEATIDRGAQHGLKQGHVVHFVENGHSFAGSGTVSEVAERTARIRIRGLIFEPAPVPTVGWKWSTRWRRR